MKNETKVTVEIVDFEVDNSYDSSSFLKLKLKLAHDGKMQPLLLLINQFLRGLCLIQTINHSLVAMINI